MIDPFGWMIPAAPGNVTMNRSVSASVREILCSLSFTACSMLMVKIKKKRTRWLDLSFFIGWFVRIQEIGPSINGQTAVLFHNN